MTMSTSHAPLVDPFARKITYLRVSVTDRCDFRCVYCMSEDMTFLPKAEILTLEELDRLCGVFIALGTDKIRLTGGEPLVRKGVMTLVESLGARIEQPHHIVAIEDQPAARGGLQPAQQLRRSQTRQAPDPTAAATRPEQRQQHPQQQAEGQAQGAEQQRSEPHRPAQPKR